MTEIVYTVLEVDDIAQIDILAARLGLAREDMVKRIMLSGLSVCEQEAAGEVEAPPVSCPRLKRGAR